MQTASGAFAAAVLSPDQLSDYRVTIDFPGNVPTSYRDVSKCVSSVTIRRRSATTVSDQATLIAGGEAASADITLAGMLNQAPGVALVEALNIAWLMNPNTTDNPMYRNTRTGLGVTIEEGFWVGGTAPEYVQTFIGVIDGCRVSNGVVTLTCVDQPITNQATLPPVITQPPQNAGLTSEFAVDYLARHSSPQRFYSWPPLHSDCVLAAGMRASVWPEVGSLLNAFHQDPSFQAGAYGTCLSYNPTLTVDYTLASPLLTTDKICGHYIMTGGTSSQVALSDDAVTYRILVGYAPGSTAVAVLAITPGGTVNTGWTVAAGKHEIEFSLAWAASSTSVTGTVWIDGVSHSVNLTALNARPVNMSFTLAAIDGQIEGVQVTKEAAYTSQYPFVPTLILDPSLNPLVALPDVSGQGAWPVLLEIAAAEGAYIGKNETGLMIFRNRDTIAAMASVRTVTSATSLAALDTNEQRSLARTRVQVPVNPLQIAPKYTIWVATSILKVDPGSSPLVFIATLSDIAVNVPTTDSGFYPDTGADHGLVYWQACTTADGTGAQAPNWAITISIEQLSATQLRVSVLNHTAQPLFMVSPSGHAWDAGLPAISIGGQTVSNNVAGIDGSTAGGSFTVDAQWPPVSSGGAASNTDFGEVNLTYPASNWRQDVDAAQDLANSALSDLHYPKPLYRNVRFVADARLQTLDVVTVQDPDVSQVNDDARILGITTTIAPGMRYQDVDLLALAPPGAWLLGVAGRSEFNATTYLY